jgi:hypothetical protein
MGWDGNGSNSKGGQHEHECIYRCLLLAATNCDTSRIFRANLSVCLIVYLFLMCLYISGLTWRYCK